MLGSTRRHELTRQRTDVQKSSAKTTRLSGPSQDVFLIPHIPWKVKEVVYFLCITLWSYLSQPVVVVTEFTVFILLTSSSATSSSASTSIWSSPNLITIYRRNVRTTLASVSLRIRGWRPSVTRFGEILPLGQMFTCLWQIFDSLFLIWQNAEPTLVKFVTLLG